MKRIVYLIDGNSIYISGARIALKIQKVINDGEIMGQSMLH